MLLTRHWLPQVYTGDAAVIALTASLLLWVALYQVADNVQCVCIFVLRSWRVTLAPLLVYCTLLWGGGLGGGYWLAYINRATSADWQKIPTPFWVATSLSLAVVAIIFVFIVRAGVYRTAPGHSARPQAHRQPHKEHARSAKDQVLAAPRCHTVVT